MASKKPIRTPKAYDSAAVWAKLDATIEAGIPIRRQYEEESRLRDLRARRLARVHVLVYLLTHGTPAFPINCEGDVGVPFDVWGHWIVRLGRSLRLIRTLPSHPCAAEMGNEEGIQAGETILNLARGGHSRADVMTCCSDALVKLRRLRSDSVARSVHALPTGITTYFGTVANWFWKSGEFMEDGVYVTALAHKQIDAIMAGASSPPLKIAGATASITPASSPSGPTTTPQAATIAEVERGTQASPPAALTETRDATGLVTNPSDPSAYVPATEIMARYPTVAKSLKKLSAILRDHPGVRRYKPEPQRLSIHVVDFDRCMQSALKPSTDDPKEIAVRTRLVREASEPRPKSRAKAGSNFPGTSRPSENR